jgi:serine/threonine protein kinase
MTKMIIIDYIMYRKSISVTAARSEIVNVEAADNIDNNGEFHIGHPRISNTDLAIIKSVSTNKHSLVTLCYQHGGISLNSLNYSTIDLAKFFRDLENVLIGLDAFNQRKLYHLDVKTSNITYDGNHVKLIDFGISEMNPQTHNSIFANIYWLWPYEVRLISGAGTTLDIYSDMVYDEFKNNPHYMRTALFLQLNDDDIHRNISLLYKYTEKQRIEIIYSKIDVYSTGIMLASIISKRDVRSKLDKVIFNQLYALCRKLVCPITTDRPTMQEAIVAYRSIIARQQA